MIAMAAWIGWAAGLLGGSHGAADGISQRVQSGYFAERKGGWLGVVRVGVCLY